MSYGIFGAEKRPVITIVMDGIGICAREEGNAIKAADTPTRGMLGAK
jgi:bisphosphoglycerate-independent phosphoglycerate mutase (AlkP superfamily)